MKVRLILFLILTISGCAALFSQEEYVPINVQVREEFIWSGMIYSMPDFADVRKIVIHGEGTVRNFDLYARLENGDWRSVKKQVAPISFPYELKFVAKTDAIRIIQKTITGKGHFNDVQFFTTVSKE